MSSVKNPKRLAVFASGFGSNFQAINNYINNHPVNGCMAMVFSNNPRAYVLERAKEQDVGTYVLEPRDFKNREEYDRKVAGIVKEEKIDLIVLAGYMLLLTPWFVNQFKNRVINIHPSLLPSFKGTRAIEDAYRYGVKITGVTVHFVDSKLDHGPIILQKEVPVKDSDTLEDLEERIHQVEHKLYPKAVEYFCNRRLEIRGRKVIIRELEKG
ncbi:MAG: phosphoribosylglycinamide formyltransferase [Actinomycetota bacterium]